MATQTDIAMGGEQARRVLQVLDAQWQPVQGTQGLPPHHLLFGPPGRRPGALEVGGTHRIDRRIESLDAGDAGIQQLDGGDLALADPTAEIQCGHFRQRETHGASSLWCGGGDRILARVAPL